MINYFAHEGIDHSSESEGLWHILRQDGLKIIAVSIVATLLLFGVIKIVSRKSKPHKQNVPKQDTTEQDAANE